MKESLFVGKSICLAPTDPEKDAEIEARWRHDSRFIRLLGPDPALPITATKIKEGYKAIEKEMDENKTTFHFAIRTRDDDRYVGFARLLRVDWPHRSARIEIGIGDPTDRQQGYGSQALKLLLHYAFDEINLRRLSAVIPAYNTVATGFFARAGFQEEVCQREALHRDGVRWDLYHLGLLGREWRDK